MTSGTVMERSHIGLHKWLAAFYLLCSSKKGIRSHQLMRTLDITYKSAWFLSHRIREAMKDGGLVLPMGGEGEIVEVDETYHGKAEKPHEPSRKRYGRPYTKGDMARAMAAVKGAERKRLTYRQPGLTGRQD